MARARHVLHLLRIAELPTNFDPLLLCQGHQGCYYVIISLVEQFSPQRSQYDIQLQTGSLDHNLLIKDENGCVKAGVGIRLQHEIKYGIYVAGLTPNGPGKQLQPFMSLAISSICG